MDQQSRPFFEPQLRKLPKSQNPRKNAMIFTQTKKESKYTQTAHNKQHEIHPHSMTTPITVTTSHNQTSQRRDHFQQALLQAHTITPTHPTPYPPAHIPLLIMKLQCISMLVLFARSQGLFFRGKPKRQGNGWCLASPPPPSVLLTCRVFVLSARSPFHQFRLHFNLLLT